MKRAWPLLLVALLAAAVAFVLIPRKGPLQAALESRRQATRVLAEYLAARHPGSRAVVVSNPFTRERGLAKGVYAQEKAGIRGLEEGFRGGIAIEAVVFPELTPEARQDPGAVAIDASSPTPLSYLMAPRALDMIAQEHPDCELLVSLVGLPVDLGQVEVWRASHPLKLALLFPDLRMIGGRAAVRDAMKSGKLAAFVVPARQRPADLGSPGEEEKPETGPGFVLVTPETIESLIESDPGLFGFAGR